MITLEDFNKIDIRVGTIIDASINKGARKKAYKLKIDFGSLGIKNSSAQITDLYKEEELIEKQIIAVVNIESIHISEVTSEVLVLGVVTNNGVVLLNPDTKVENGTKIL
ncbi:MAG TPA: tRNA-binding protein [Candidatus Onthousia faecipullorum]|uniref:tRNA-binding protein n=1 Tax=Candidatus Onthousia faecipullorum TaxID=2840887 RepID=A0A9D1GBE2_9FIRM|nr:tRNA-binding protein [Candidatus Onthousia faecipullorum]